MDHRIRHCAGGNSFSQTWSDKGSRKAVGTQHGHYWKDTAEGLCKTEQTYLYWFCNSIQSLLLAMKPPHVFPNSLMKILAQPTVL